MEAPFAGWMTYIAYVEYAHAGFWSVIVYIQIVEVLDEYWYKFWGLYQFVWMNL